MLVSLEGGQADLLEVLQAASEWQEISDRAQDVLKSVKALELSMASKNTGLFVVHKFESYKSLAKALSDREKILVKVLARANQSLTGKKRADAPSESEYHSLITKYQILHVLLARQENDVRDYATNLDAYEGCGSGRKVPTAVDVVRSWQEHATDAALVAKITSDSAYLVLADHDLAIEAMSHWRTDDNSVCADFSDQSRAKVSINAVDVLNARRDSTGKIYVPAASPLGNAVTFQVFQGKDGRPPTRLVITSRLEPILKPLEVADRL